MSRLASLFLTTVLCPLAIQAQPDTAGTLEECTSIADDAARLVCFDTYARRGSEAPDAAMSENTARPPDRSDAPKDAMPPGDDSSSGAERLTSRREDRRGSEPQPAPDEHGTDVQTARIETFERLNRSNRIRITLDNGQVWQENDGAPFRGNLEPGTEVTITKGRFGGYRMTVPTRSAAIFVRRVR